MASVVDCPNRWGWLRSFYIEISGLIALFICNIPQGSTAKFNPRLLPPVWVFYTFDVITLLLTYVQWIRNRKEEYNKYTWAAKLSWRSLACLHDGALYQPIRACRGEHSSCCAIWFAYSFLYCICTRQSYLIIQACWSCMMRIELVEGIKCLVWMSCFV